MEGRVCKGQVTCPAGRQPVADGVAEFGALLTGVMLGKSKTSGRKAVLFFGPDGTLMSCKWRNIKIWFAYSEGDDKPIVTPQWPMVFDLGSDPAERYTCSTARWTWAG